MLNERTLEIINETGKIGVNQIENIKDFQNELDKAGYNSYLDSSTDYLIVSNRKTLEEIKREIEENTDIFNEPDFINYIVETFGDYTYNGVSEIIVTREGNKFQAYANEKDSPIIVIEVEEKESVGDYPVLGIENVYVY